MKKNRQKIKEIVDNPNKNENEVNHAGTTNVCIYTHTLTRVALHIYTGVIRRRGPVPACEVGQILDRPGHLFVANASPNCVPGVGQE